MATARDTVDLPVDSFEPPVPDVLAASRRTRLAARVSELAGALLAAALVLFFAFQAGGFFPGSVGVAACALAVLLTLRVTLARRPFACVGPAAAVCAAALAAYAAWTLASAEWSGAPGRALVEFDRALLYLLAFLLAVTLAAGPRRLALAVRATAGAVVVVGSVSWGSRVLPNVIETDPGASPDRLSFPLTYWNGQGLMAALGLLLVVHLACSAREPRWIRALAAAAAPVLISALYLTFSRGAILAGVVGMVAYLLLNRSRGLLTGGLAVLPATAVALLATYEAEAFALEAGTAARRLEQGEEVAIAVGLCSLAAFILRLVADRWLDPPLHRVALPSRVRAPVRIAGALLAVTLVVGTPLALGAPSYVERTFDRFLSGTTTSGVDQRVRLLNPGNNGRLDHWRVGIETWQAHPWIGSGAGSYTTEWTQRRALDFDVLDAHSLYVEVLAELGVVGMVMLGIALLTIFATVLRRALGRRRGPEGDRSLDAVVVALLVAWGTHAGLDWIWELPALTAWLFVLAGLALASQRREGAGVQAPGPQRVTRVAIGIGCLVLAVVPAQLARSQVALDRAVAAFRGTPQNCPAAIDASLASLGAVGPRAEPWEIIAYCDVGVGEFGFAVQAARNAVARDPDRWTYHYALALVQGVAGEDPRPAAARALELNPEGRLTRAAVERFEESRSRGWPRIARELELPLG